VSPCEGGAAGAAVGSVEIVGDGDSVGDMD